MRGLIRKGLRITPEATKRSLVRVDELFAEIGERLDKTRYLTSDQFTAADLAFAALAAPILLPPQYGAALPTPDQLPDELRALVLRYRETRAGQFALALFADERNNTLPASGDGGAIDEDAVEN
jgi:glutathione S-transferase